MKKMCKGIFVTGTGTDVGKTYVTGLIVKHLRECGCNMGYYKAALSGALLKQGDLIPQDALFVKELAHLKDDTKDMVPYVYRHEVSPHLAARLEGNPINMEVVKSGYEKLKKRYDYITVEGSGGIVCPLRMDEQVIMLEDVIKELQIPCILVANAGLGTINAVVLTVSYMKQKGIPIKGIIINQYHKGDPCEEDNKRVIEQLTQIPILACVKEGDKSIELLKDFWLSLYE